MLEILQFIFSSFWIWLGFIIIFFTTLDAVLSTIKKIIYHLSCKNCETSEENFKD